LIKNKTPPDSPFYERVTHTLGLLRVVEAVRAGEGDAAVGGLYTAMGLQIHNGVNSMVSPAQVLADTGLAASYADAYNDVSWDGVISSAMDEGLALTGQEVGTPIIGLTREDGSKVGFFGPVISRRLPMAQALNLWDGLQLFSTVDAFWELKRTRTESPDFTDASQ
jgi:hypothetical protein